MRILCNNILSATNVKLSVEGGLEDNRFQLLSFDALLNYQSRKKSNLPVLASTPVTISLSDNKSIFAYVNIPSEKLKLLSANPVIAKSMFSMPDRTSDQFVRLQQGEKWRTHRNFRPLIFTHNEIDFWSGYVFEFVGGSTNIHFLVVFSYDGKPCCVYLRLHGFNYLKRIKLETLLGVDSTPVNVALCYSVSPGKVFHLISRRKTLLEEPHFLKRHVLYETGKPIDPKLFHKVRIAPIILFTDDTSGNRSKQYNPYKSWSMKCAALSYEKRYSIENIHFLSVIPKKKRASGMSLLPTIVEDFKRLENGLMMFSTQDNENVLVASPLLWVEADTPCHSELCGLRASTWLYPCRKCYVVLQRTTEKLKDEVHYMGRHDSRTKEHYLIAASTLDRSYTVPDAPLTGKTFKASKVSFRNRATDAFEMEYSNNNDSICFNLGLLNRPAICIVVPP
ncbi:hypothetical protein PHYBLDRAFT_163814 [Phycomyces blakesleeanus NRRL 1555(-)]|uniref:C2H2-type zinc finger transcription factor n=1 Tax=Phycomyces blakesleeanus (strain ATCC 8743b / DSM 1359 / FGSC 10004 / NBRC 33097 / NRRL 1555) TaxID=763407 RepID=A0A162UY11_PHYB8|nr:hypothetical protein PHYBLDRAFT_163814 [Phycomyces blakesleeanus NRRL 1555(-)]OAD78722.1 hypothetical protein PHYBLDRAFT_163814 [Phycomyces blakesleeanus NRRL 1555(-)]|eukprot:XP_018296762.1 hypothetical protein PHYBLDRAFT_163814 [Phycomyces blakesleeanus NRRL 1555(-)]